MFNFLLGAMWGINGVGLYLGRGQTWVHVLALVGTPLILAMASTTTNAERSSPASDSSRVAEREEMSA